ncbi:MAG: PQQ-binding-like beta-propeller repeat protein [Deltaproteobacteria bacterium]|nr:PQQ-binding-like beta-propeller repeat protein [Deltaproteobacteria bacterium]
MTRSHRGRIVVCWSIGLVVAACGGSSGTGTDGGGYCNTTGDCPPGQVCVGNRCRTLDGSIPDDGFAGSDGDGAGDVPDGVGPCIPTDERCGNGVDDDCDGATDEADCRCRPGEVEPCYDGPPGTAGLGACRGGGRICEPDGAWGACLGQVLPEEADEVSCDGLDNDCDGASDEGMLNACGGCGAPPPELCGNSLDDDCDGAIDEDCACDPLCALDDPTDCHPPTRQPCYQGPPGTLGFGLCRGGLHDCVRSGDAWVWTPCVGQVLPQTECAAGPDGLDDDCDGSADEDCLPDRDGDGFAPPEDCDDGDAGVHPGAVEICDGIDNDCDGVADEGVTNGCGGCGEPAAEETCGDGLDNDCDGEVDEGCSCEPGVEAPCYGGPPGTAAHPPCHAGTMTCTGGEISSWGPCVGEMRPGIEVCNGADDDCDGLADEHGAVGSNPCGECVFVESCDGIDNDCDGLTDEGLRNACGDCLPVPEETLCNGIDDDCDGLTDEGLVNACGLCPPEECFETPYPDPGECEDAGRVCDGTVPWPDDPTSITLGEGSVSNPYIYVALDGLNQVAKLDTVTGTRIWQVPSHGTSPSRTAVALDHTVWVGNRGFANPSDPSHSNLVHLDADGNLVCRADIPGIVRGVAIDGDGNVWAGTWDTTRVWKVAGSAVDTTLSPPRCQVLTPGGINIGVPFYGLAVDGSGYLWSCSPGSPVRSIRMDTRTHAYELVQINACYGIAVSPRDGRVWFGSYHGTGCVNSVTGTPPYTRLNTPVGCGGVITAVTLDSDGYVWASSYSQNRVYKIDPATGTQLCSAPITGPPGTTVNDARGVAMDAAGKMWVVHREGGYANRFLRDCSLDATFEISRGNTAYTYSDMTGMQLRTVTTREGHWIQDYDSGYPSPVWSRVTWVADIPAETTMQLTVTAADTQAELTTAPTPPCGPFTTSPADLTACPWLAGHRWLRLDIRLTTIRDGVRPVVHDVRVYWSY